MIYLVMMTSCNFIFRFILGQSAQLTCSGLNYGGVAMVIIRYVMSCC